MNKYRCKECGSENLVWRAYAAWDFESQEFKIVQADEEPDFTAFCDNCNAEEEPVKVEPEDNLEDKDDLIGLVIEQINNDQKNGDLEALYEFLNFVDSDLLIKYLSITLQDIALERGIINSVPISRTGLRETSLERRIKELKQRVIDLQNHDDLSYIDKKLKEQESAWTGLTDDEVEEVFTFPFHYRSFYKAVEAKLKKKNGG